MSYVPSSIEKITYGTEKGELVWYLVPGTRYQVLVVYQVASYVPFCDMSFYVVYVGDQGICRFKEARQGCITDLGG